MNWQGTVLRFPPQFHVIALVDERPGSPLAPNLALVKHGQRTYRLANLLAHLCVDELETVSAAMPCTGQLLWDEVVRLWPGLAEEAVAGCEEAGIS